MAGPTAAHPPPPTCASLTPAAPGFETGQYQRIGDTFYYTANELGMCPGVVWDLVTRAALWSAPNSTGPWTRVTTLRNGSHIQTLCNKATPCRAPCGPSCCSGTEADPSFVTWAPTLVHAPSSANDSKPVWNMFYSSNQNSHMGDKAFNGITWAVSTTDSMEGPYVDVVGKNGTALPAGAEGVLNVAVNDTHAFSAWTLPNGVSSAAPFAPRPKHKTPTTILWLRRAGRGSRTTSPARNPSALGSSCQSIRTPLAVLGGRLALTSHATVTAAARGSVGLRRTLSPC